MHGLKKSCGLSSVHNVEISLPTMFEAETHLNKFDLTNYLIAPPRGGDCTCTSLQPPNTQQENVTIFHINVFNLSLRTSNPLVQS